MPRRRSPVDISRAIARLRDEPKLTLDQLSAEPVEVNGVTIRPTGAVLLRWGTTGRGGVYLDVLFDRRRAAWVSSREAVERFRAEMRAARSKG